MSGADLDARVRAIVARCAGREAAELSPSTPLFAEGLDLDSLTVVRIVSALEEELGVGLDEDDLDLDTLESVGSLTRFVRSQGAS